MPTARPIAIGLLLSLLVAGGCGTLTTSRPACRWGSAAEPPPPADAGATGGPSAPGDATP
jgi:hypothetical protein